jgi:3,4-dihydroxy 2-butanone 4-phosphate synthase/GTP cyclohydrolase II
MQQDEPYSGFRHYNQPFAIANRRAGIVTVNEDAPRGLAGVRPFAPRVAPPVATAARRDAGTGLATINEALEAIANGEIIIVVDDADRENEGDFVMAAQWVTPAAVNFMVTEGRGLLCLPMAGARLDHLGLGPMVPELAGREETAFTISIDVEEAGNTGISAAARARCIRTAIDSDTQPDDLRRPGHVFPLRARVGGVLERPGHTEASVDLARLAGLVPAGVICEIMNPDGTMARLPELLEVARTHGLLLVSIEDLITWRQCHADGITAPAAFDQKLAVASI